MQRFDRAVGNIAWQQETKVIIRCAMTNHPHSMLVKTGEHIFAHAGCLGELIANQSDQSKPGFHFNATVGGEGGE